MPALHELQSDFMDALFGRQPTLPANAAAHQAVAAHIAAGGLDPLRRIGIYANNLQQSLGAALAAVYPTVHELVGEDFFAGLASRYIRQHPSRSGNLQEFGGLLPAFIASLPATAGLPYLADVARLDWAWHVVFHTAPAPACDAGAALSALATAPEASRAAAQLRWQPAARLVASSHPVFTIWHWHQRPADERQTMNLDSGAEQVLVHAHAGDVQVLPLDAAEHGLLAAFSAGGCLAAAAGAALAADPMFDLAPALARHIANGVLGMPTWPPATACALPG